MFCWAMPFDNYFASTPKTRRRFTIPKPTGPLVGLEMRGPGDLCWTHILDVPESDIGAELAQWRDDNLDFQFRIAPD